MNFTARVYDFLPYIPCRNFVGGLCTYVSAGALPV